MLLPTPRTPREEVEGALRLPCRSSMNTPLLLALVLGLFPIASCKSPHAAADLPPGKGLISFDREPPPGVETFPRPTWRAGDRFVYRKGGQARMPSLVEADGDGWRLVQEDGRPDLRLDADFGDLGQAPKEGDEGRVTNDPVDARFSWPLWDGKRWSCQFVRRTMVDDPFPLHAEYEVRGEEQVKVPAGSFRCLRIWRTTRPAKEGNFIALVSLLWYAPEIGYVVRTLDNGIVTELEEVHRQ